MARSKAAVVQGWYSSVTLLATSAESRRYPLSSAGDPAAAFVALGDSAELVDASARVRPIKALGLQHGGILSSREGVVSDALITTA
jgi:hypothetical protein